MLKKGLVVEKNQISADWLKTAGYQDQDKINYFHTS